MKSQFNHDLLTSFYLWLNNRVLNNGQGYVNIPTTTGMLQTETSRTGFCWAFPQKGWVYDSSASGAYVASGFYNQNGNFLTRASGISIDYVHGRVFSPTNFGPILTGQISRNEYNVYVATQEELDFYLEKAFNEDTNLKYSTTGAPFYKFAAPCIIITEAHGRNKPFAFGGQDYSERMMRAFIISDSIYNQEAINSLFADSARSYFPLISSTNSPLNVYGDVKNGSYNYIQLRDAATPKVYIEDVVFMKMSPKNNKNKTFLLSIAEFDTLTVRYPRQESL